MAKRAIVRFEDMGPYSHYVTADNLQKLRIIADYLYSQGVPFQVSVIPRAFDPKTGYDKSIADLKDPEALGFHEVLSYFIDHGGYLNMEGYTHQFGLETIGYEFNWPLCVSNCPPDDLPDACSDRNLFESSYASSRMRIGINTFQNSALPYEGYFVTPNYAASKTQRCILESWQSVFCETDPDYPTSKTITIKDTDHAFYRGVVFIPTPLDFVRGGSPDEDVNRICSELPNYSGFDIACFYYHPYLEFPFIQLTESGYIYDDNSYLKRLIRCFKEQGFTFITIEDVLYFNPNMRQTNFFPGSGYIFFTGDVNADKKTDFIIWNPESGTWYIALSGLEDYPYRQNGGFSQNIALTNWAKGTVWRPFIGDFNGDKQSDIVVLNPNTGDWQVALSFGSKFVPQGTWLKPWAVGTAWVPFIGDFNGDGKSDIVVLNPATGDWQVALSDGSRFIPQGTWLKPFGAGGGYTPLVGDFNGDGKDDIVIWNPNNGSWQVALSTGSSFVSQGTWLNSWAIGTNWKPLIGDFNGDGRDDLLVVDVAKGDWQVAPSTGTNFKVLTAYPFVPWCADSTMQPFTGHFNGNAKCSICARHPNLRGGTIDIAVSRLKPITV